MIFLFLAIKLLIYLDLEIKCYSNLLISSFLRNKFNSDVNIRYNTISLIQYSYTGLYTIHDFVETFTPGFSFRNEWKLLWRYSNRSE